MEASEQPEDFRVVFANGVAILNFMRRWTDNDRMRRSRHAERDEARFSQTCP